MTKEEHIWQLLEEITDPEIPVLSIVDLGIVREVLISPPATGKDPAIEVIITPTYSGCPAMDVIAMSIKMVLLKNGFTNNKVTSQLSPAWTTDWLSEAGKDKLRAYGIAPPSPSDGPRLAAFHESSPTSRPSDGTASDGRVTRLLSAGPVVECPLCRSKNTAILSQFGSTACKALYRCNDCLEPFDYFKCH